MAREPIAIISRNTIGRHKVVGRDARGRNREHKIPVLKGMTMLDPAGTEAHSPLANGRVYTAAMREKYSPRILADLIEAGFVPKTVCPLTTRWSHLTGGALATFEPGAQLVEGEGDDQVVHKLPATECSIDEANPPPHGCVHYRKLKEIRRADTAAEARARKAPHRLQEGPGEAILEMAKEVRGLAAAVGGAAAREERSQAIGKASRRKKLTEEEEADEV